MREPSGAELNRRLVLKGLSLGLGLVGCCGANHAFAQFPPGTAKQQESSGEDQATDKSHFIGCLVKARRGMVDSGSLGQARATSGDTWIDQGTPITARALSRAFGVTPGVAYLLEAGEPNALATPLSFAGFGGPDGTVMLGLKLIRSEVLKGMGPFLWGTAVMTVVAHEFGHISQFSRLGHSLGGGKAPELHADYLAGWFIAQWNRNFASHQGELQNPSVLQRALYARGDFAFNDPQHHGTPAERGREAMRGFQDGQRTDLGDFSDIFEASWTRLRPS